MEVVDNHEVDIFHVNLSLADVPELTQADLDLITELWLQDLDDAIPLPNRANNAEDSAPPTLTTSDDSTSFSAQRPSANSPATPDTPPCETQVAHCVVCDEDVENFVRVPCEDVYCITCLCELFELATNDESLMPPKCCHTVIPLDLAASHLHAPLRTKFERKLEEHNTLNRLYCINPSCAAFIGSGDGPRRGVQCPTCYFGVCTSCKKGAHLGACKQDKETENAIKFCRQQGWQRCPGCEEMVELSHGCYHMTCICRTEFCYVCRARWKTCGCVRWIERNLLVATREQARAVPVPVPVPPARPVDQPIQRAGSPQLVLRPLHPRGVPVIHPPAQNPIQPVQTHDQPVRRAGPPVIQRPLPVVPNAIGPVNAVAQVVQDQAQRPLVVINPIQPARND